MKGIVFNLLEEVVSREYGEDTWDRLLDMAELDGSYTSLGSYEDGDIAALVRAASMVFELPPDTIVRWFGREAIPLFADLYPQLFAPYTSTRSFLLTLNDIIHPEVRKLYPGADVPVFDYHASSNGTLAMGYSSPRKLCAFAEGLIEGTAAHYAEMVTIEQPTCMNRGAPKCLLNISFGHVRS